MMGQRTVDAGRRPVDIDWNVLAAVGDVSI
jgi:hypothetical protein